MTYSIPLGLRIDQDTFKKLRKLAKVMERDKSEVVRILICDADIEAYKQSVHKVQPEQAAVHPAPPLSDSRAEVERPQKVTP